MIVFDKVTKKYSDGTVALNEASFTIDKGEFIFLVGPTGSGKTTVLKLLLRQIEPSSGKITVDDQQLAKIPAKKIYLLRRKIGAAFQDFKLLFDRTVFENVSLALEILGKKPEEIKTEVKKSLSLVGLADKANSFPVQLSGGEFQRTVIARAVIAKPKILFADEPTGNLDRDTCWQIVNLLKKINNDGTTVIMSTHNLEIIGSLNQRVIKLKKGRVISDKEKVDKKESKKKDKK
jgi:cell division transport system ATP-binding protein